MRWVWAVLLVICSNPLRAEVGYSIGTGYGVADIVPFRIALAKTWHKTWRDAYTWHTSGYFELSAYHLPGKSGSKAGSHNKLHGAALAAVARFKRQEPTKYGTWPFIDLGFGVAYLSKTEIGGRLLGSHFQFEDRLGIGFQFGKKRQFELGYRAIHFSNAYLADSNHGINLHMIIFTYWL